MELHKKPHYYSKLLYLRYYYKLSTVAEAVVKNFMRSTIPVRHHQERIKKPE